MVSQVLLAALLLSGIKPAKSTVELNIAVFSEQQAFWTKENSSGTALSAKDLSIGIFPLAAADYSERIPCDSCHWLSPNGVQFAVENYLREAAAVISAAGSVELVAPKDEMVAGYKIDLVNAVKSIEFPFEKWFDGYHDRLIYRARDSFTPGTVKEKLNKLGGTLGFSHLLIPCGFRMRVDPVRSNNHRGKMDYQFYLVFWNVSLAFPEWVLYYREKTKKGNLDAQLKQYFDRSLLPALKDVPQRVRELRAQEPK
jgi:hypothetical protein